MWGANAGVDSGAGGGSAFQPWVQMENAEGSAGAHFVLTAVKYHGTTCRHLSMSFCMALPYTEATQSATFVWVFAPGE